MSEEIIKLLSENLEIEIDHSVSFGPENNIEVKLLLFGNVISESSMTLPDNN